MLRLQLTHVSQKGPRDELNSKTMLRSENDITAYKF